MLRHLCFRWGLRLFFVGILAVMQLPIVYAGEAIKVQFAGFAFGGDHSTFGNRFPHSQRINQRNEAEGGSQLNSIALAQIGKVSIDGVAWVIGDLGKLDQGPALAMAMVLTRETVSIEQIGDMHKLVVDLAAEALFFDFKEQQVIASFPVVVQLRDVSSVPPDEATITARVQSIFDGSSGVSLFKELASSMKGMTVREKYKLRIGVREVQIEEPARNFMPTNLAKPGAAEQWLAQSFSSYLVANQHVALVPYIKDSAIGNKMAGRFADGRVFSLTLPQPDYAVDLVLRGFKKVRYSENSAGSSWIYGAFSDIRVYEQLSQREYFKGSLKQGATKIVPASQKGTEDWPAFQETLLKLYSDFSEQIGVADKDWVKSHSGDTSLVDSLKALNNIMEKCR